MKKLLVLLACLTIFGGFMVAQASPESEDPFEREKFEKEKTKVEIIVPQDQHLEDKNASVRMEYMPIYDEVRIYYTTLYVTYDRGEAMNTVLACLADFQKEHKYNSYRYLKEDRERYFKVKNDRGQRKAEYSSSVKFTR